jgi:hypothetical protein
MMLLYKAWRESRSRFLLGALALAWVIVSMVWFGPEVEGGLARPPGEFVNALVGGIAKFIFAMLAILLGLGGLLRERAQRTAVFTLALPVSRAQLMGAQIVVGLAEMAALALLPTLLIPPVSAMVHHPYPVSDAWHFSVLWFGGGAVIFAASFLLSVVLRGEYAAPLSCLLALLLNARLSQWSVLKPYQTNPLRTMGLANFFVSGGLWKNVVAMIAVSLLLFLVAIKITERQNI